MNPFLQKLHGQPLLCDGAMGTMLYARGASSAQCLEQLVVDRPAWVSGIHQAYAAAGADLITTHTFGANRMRLAKHGLEDKVREFNFRAVRLVRDVREVSGRALFIAGNIGPLGKRLDADDVAQRAEAEEVFREQIGVLWEAGADLLLFETFSDLRELLIGVQIARSLCDLPIVASMTYAEDGLTPAGQRADEVAAALAQAGADVIGVNCSVGPAQMLETVETMAQALPKLLFSAMPNAGYPRRVEGRLIYPSSPEYFAEHVPLLIERGADLVGGCCGTTPMHIRAMRDALDDYLAHRSGTPPPVVAMPQDALPELHVGMSAEVDAERGERPTGVLQKLRGGQVRDQRGGRPAARLHRRKAVGGRTLRQIGGRRRRQRSR